MNGTLDNSSVFLGVLQILMSPIHLSAGSLGVQADFWDAKEERMGDKVMAESTILPHTFLVKGSSFIEFDCSD